MKNITYVIAITIALMGLILIVSGTEVSEGAEITVPTDYGSINMAIWNANPGDNITVLPGEYPQGVIVNKEVNIYGSGNDTIITGDLPESNLVLNETFEGGIPPNWTNGFNAWQISTTRAVSGTNSVWYNDGPQQSNLITWGVDCTNYTTIDVSFWYYPTNMEEWDCSLILSDQAGGIGAQYELGVLGTNNQWNYFNETIYPFDGNDFHVGFYQYDTVWLQFYGRGEDTGEQIWIDDINIYGVQNPYGVEIKSDNVVFDGFNVTNSENDGIYINTSDNVTISNCTVQYNGDNGIYIYSSDYTKIENCTINNNAGDGIYSVNSNYTELYNNEVVEQAGGGIWIEGGHEVIISKSKFKANNLAGIYLDTGDYCVVTDNDFEDNDNTAIATVSVTDSEISKNTISGSPEYAIALHLSNNNTIEDNEIDTSNISALYLSSSNDNIIDNVIFVENDIATYLLSSSNNTIKNCNYTDNNYGIYISGDSYDNVIHTNYFSNNTNPATDSTNNTWYNPATYRGNTWVEYDGYDVDGDGVGETAYLYDLYPLTDTRPLPSQYAEAYYNYIISLILFLALIGIVVRAKKKINN